MTEPDFRETGASGRCYSRTEIISTLVERYSTPEFALHDHWRIEDFDGFLIPPDHVLTTYTLAQQTETGERITRRSTLWRWTGKTWTVRYHQGTETRRPS